MGFQYRIYQLSESAPIPYLSFFNNALCICAPVCGQSLHLCSESCSPLLLKTIKSLPPPSFPSFCSRIFPVNLQIYHSDLCFISKKKNYSPLTFTPPPLRKSHHLRSLYTLSSSSHPIVSGAIFSLDSAKLCLSRAVVIPMLLISGVNSQSSLCISY